MAARAKGAIMGRWLVAAAVSGLIAVAAGAFAAHGLQARPGDARLDWLETGSRYQMYHALALLAVALMSRDRLGRSQVLRLAGWGFLAGSVLFSGSLYLLALTGLSPLVWVTPAGGVLMLLGWAALARHGLMLWRPL
jgi:uncharacterized membrane protein YgdD (TMEM256/DUF423 family)